MLIKKTWHELYIEFCANPLENKTDKAWCEENAINYDTLMAWKKDHRRAIFDEVDKRRKEFIKTARAMAYKNLMEKIRKGDTNALKLFFQLSGDLIERTENRTEVLSPQDLKRGINEMLKEITERKKAWETGEGMAKGTPTPTGDVPVSTNEPMHEPRKDLPPTGTV